MLPSPVMVLVLTMVVTLAAADLSTAVQLDSVVALRPRVSSAPAAAALAYESSAERYEFNMAVVAAATWTGCGTRGA